MKIIPMILKTITKYFSAISPIVPKENDVCLVVTLIAVIISRKIKKYTRNSYIGYKETFNKFNHFHEPISLNIGN